MYRRVPGEGKDRAMGYDVDTLRLARAQSVSGLDSAGLLAFSTKSKYNSNVWPCPFQPRPSQ